MKMRIFHRGLILVGVPLLLEFIFIGSLSFLMYQSVQQRAAETRCRRYSSEIANIMGYISSAPLILATAVQYHSPKLQNEYARQVAEIRGSLSKLKKIMAELPGISPQDYSKLELSVNSILGVADNIAAHSEEISSARALDEIQSIQSSLQHAKQAVALHLDSMFLISDRMALAAQEQLDDTRAKQFQILELTLVLNLLMGLALGLFYKKGITDRLKTIAKNTEALSRNEPLAAAIGGSDEIAEFDRAFHSMLQQLMAASKNEQDLFQSTSDVICILDAQNQFLKVNPASLKDWGLSPEELVGISLADLIEPEDLPAVNSAIAECVQSGTAVTFEARVRANVENKRKTGLWSAYWSSEEARLYCIVHDITESKQVDLAKKHFLKLISSDLKIPLSKISQSLETLPELAASQLSALGADRLSMARKNVHRLLALVNDLLQVAEMESGSLELNLQETEISELLSRAKSDIEPLANAKSIEVELLIGGQSGPLDSSSRKINVDPDRIIQVLVNLLSNAIKFSPESTKVVLSVECGETGAIFKVMDSGRGVPVAHQKAIFEKFSQVEIEDGKRKAGTGLGLPICKNIVEEHGGEIGLDSEEGKGSTFWFSVRSQAGSKQHIGTVVPEGLPGNTASRDLTAADESERAAPANTAMHPEQTSKSNEPASTSGKHPFGTVLPLRSKGFLLIGIPVIFELGLIAFLSNSLHKMDADRAQELRMRQMAVSASKVSKAVLHSTSVTTEDAQSIEWNDLKAAYQEWAGAQKELEKLVDDDNFAKAEFASLLQQNRKLKLYRDSIVRTRNDESPLTLVNKLSEKMKYLPVCVKVVHHLRKIIEHAEHEEFLSPEKQQAIVHKQFALLAGGVLLSAGFSAALAALFSLGISRRILIMSDNAVRLASEEPLNPLMGGKDELAQLDFAFHKTARALAEARKKERAVFDNCKDVLCVISAEEQFVSLNSAVERAWGYNRKELQNHGIESVIFEEDLGSAREALRNRESQNAMSLDLRVVKNSQEQIHTLWSISRKAGHNNIFCVVRDITDQKVLEQMRQEFLGMVSHDLRTPLTAIKGVAQLIMTGGFGKLEPDAHECVREIVINSDALLELINDILDLEKLDSGKMQLSLEEVEIDEIVESVQKLLSNCGANLQIQNSGGYLAVSADKDRLSHAISNLCKYLVFRKEEDTPVQLRIMQHNADVQISIIDEGPVLDESIRQQLFQKIKESAISEKIRDVCFHADLALPLAARTVESHGGAITIEPGQNSNIFRVTIPVLDE